MLPAKSWLIKILGIPTLAVVYELDAPKVIPVVVRVPKPNTCEPRSNTLAEPDTQYSCGTSSASGIRVTEGGGGWGLFGVFYPLPPCGACRLRCRRFIQ